MGPGGRMNIYEKIKLMSISKMTRWLEKVVVLPFDVAILNKRQRLNYIKQWLQQESEE